MKKLPIGIQTFDEIINGGYLYIDKTEAYHNAFKDGKYYFLSRPRRFGKSLMLSTLKALYEGKKELFKGLWIADKWDWTKTFPVIMVDLNDVITRGNGSLENGLLLQMQQQAHAHNITLKANNPGDAIKELIETIGATGQKVVVLVDEYDKPITDFLDDPDKSLEHVQLLKGFYGTLKSKDRFIHLAVVTGVSKYGRVAIFSDLNNLNDVSMVENTATICGYTQEELEYYFAEYIEKGIQRFETTRAELMDNIRFWYNGYTFDNQKTAKVYNPFSILNFFYRYAFQNYWFDTGTPTFLAELISKEHIDPARLEYLKGTDIMFKSADLRHADALSLLFQTGYLTIKDVKGSMTDKYYILGYPNQEVRQSFVTYLLAEYMQDTPTQISSEVIVEIRAAIKERDWNAFFEVINRVFATVPYQLFKNNESYYHSLVHIILTLTDHLVLSELSTNKGRIDTVLKTKDLVVIFEFKMNSTPEIALAQIHEKGYAERYGEADKELILIGVNFDSAERKITTWTVE